MVHYQYKQNDLKVYIRNGVWMTCKIPCVWAIFCSVIAIFSYIVGFCAAKQFLYCAYVATGCATLALIMIVGVGVRFNMYFKEMFENADENGNVEQTICVEDGDFVITEAVPRTIGRIQIKKIQWIKFCGKCIFIKSKLGTVLLPKTNELVSFFWPYMNF